ncbi:DNA-directed DNA polymerase epsilon, subunit B [Dimargaris verticillata]|uniref:DNA polymerase epsilon subunit n=1 Tax=Dimargaris verticillata TaxID=2761393 RepID=A0A9W8E9P2_9FUNG|nr:DNA-directed DNA polymerase epsilon, subunit B [Dimargaris verticillata]
MSIQQQIYRTFTKTHGLTLKADASHYLQQTLFELQVRPVDIPEWLDSVATLWLTRSVNTSMVELESLKTVVLAKLQTHQVPVSKLQADPSTVNDSGLDSDLGLDNDMRHEQSLADVDIRDHFHVIDAFTVPRWRYDTLRKKFVPYSQPAQLLSAAEAKAQIHQDRYDLIRQRLMRNEHFVPSTFSADPSADVCRLDVIESLQGREGESFMLFGMLSQLEEGVLSLEDKHKSVRLDLSEISSHNQSSGMFTENSFVLVEGIYEDNVLRVEAIGLPPPESRLASSEASMVVLSDVWLDSPVVLDKLKTLFRGFETSSIPLAFVFMGSFSSEPFLMSGKESLRYKGLFDNLATIIQSYRQLAETSYFIFVPGPNDPWSSDLLPRPAIPEFFTQTLRRKVKRCHFTSNPCRIKYCNREMVLFRQDIMNRMRRNCVIVPSDDDSRDVKQHLVRTLIDQSHLCPLPLRTAPIYWAFDHALRLYPIPDALVLADRYDSYAVEYEECQCLNPGSFATNDFGFYVYYLSKGIAQFSAIPK